jgi:hypothetical protein
MLHYTVNKYCHRNIKFLNLICCIVFCCCIYKNVFHNFFSRIPSSLLRVGYNALWYNEFDMHSNVKTPVTLHDYKPGACDLYAWVIDQSKADIFIKPGIIYFCKGRYGSNKRKSEVCKYYTNRYMFWVTLVYTFLNEIDLSTSQLEDKSIHLINVFTGKNWSLQSLISNEHKRGS